MSDNLSVDGAIRALDMAVKQQEHRFSTLIHHSDRGIQYCCDLYQEKLKDNGILRSMTEKPAPYANAVVESVCLY